MVQWSPVRTEGCAFISVTRPGMLTQCFISTVFQTGNCWRDVASVDAENTSGSEDPTEVGL